MKQGEIICNTLKAIIVGWSLGLMAFYVSCDVNNSQSSDVHQITSVTDYLDQDYLPFHSFDEWSMKGDIMLWPVANFSDGRIVLVKDEDSVVHVVRVGYLSQVLTYSKKDWGWYNRVVFTGPDSCVYDRYILKDSIIELKIATYSDGRVSKEMYVKTREECIVSKLQGTCTWRGDELPKWHEMNTLSSTVFKLGKGKKASYYLPSSFWDEREYYLEYPVDDTTIFSRSPGFGYGNATLMHCKESGPLLEYERDEDGIFKTVEVKPRCVSGQQALAKYIYRHSGPMVRKVIQKGRIPINLCISDAGNVVRCELYGDYVDNSQKDKLEKQICRAIPIKFEPATIFGHPVSCWYTIYIDHNDVGYHRDDGKEEIIIPHTIKSWPSFL